MPTITDLARRVVSTVQRFVSQAAQPPPAPPANATAPTQAAYQRDAFQEKVRAVGGLLSGIARAAPPITGGAPPISTVEGLASLEPGDTDAAIAPLQDFLRSTVDPHTGEPYLAPGATGFFGNGTQRALENFQRDQGLTATGRPDAATLERLQDPRPQPDARLDRALDGAPAEFGAPRGEAYATFEGLRQDFDGGYALRAENRTVTFLSYDGQLLGRVVPPPEPRTDAADTLVSFRQGGATDWADLQLGEEEDVSIREAGCAMTSAAMAISTVLGREVTPQELDGLLDTNGGYTGSLLKWDVAASATDTRVESALFNRDELNERMNENPGVPIAMQVMVSEPARDDAGNVLLNDDGTTRMREWPHWIVVTHAEEGPNGETLYHAVDPATGSGTEGAAITLTMNENDQLTTVAPWGQGAVSYATTSQTGLRQFFPLD